MYNSYLKRQEKIIELRLHIKIKAIANSKGSCFIDVQSFLKNNGLPNDMQVEILNDNIIKIIISTKYISEERLFIAKSIERIEKIINIYSYISKIGLRIISSSLERIPRKMISIRFEKVVQMYHAIKFDKIQKYLNLNENYDFILKGYNYSLCEINPRAKILTLWGIVEDIFFNCKGNLVNSKNQSIIDTKEKSKIKEILKNINISGRKIKLICQSISKLTNGESKLSILDDEELITFKNELQKLKISTGKINKIYNRICELNLNDRNSVIAENIYDLLNEDLNVIKEKVRSASKHCGKQRHTTEESAKGVLDSINFLQSIIEKCIDKIFSNYS